MASYEILHDSAEGTDQRIPCSLLYPAPGTKAAPGSLRTITSAPLTATAWATLPWQTSPAELSPSLLHSQVHTKCEAHKPHGQESSQMTQLWVVQILPLIPFLLQNQIAFQPSILEEKLGVRFYFQWLLFLFFFFFKHFLILDLNKTHYSCARIHRPEQKMS